MVVCLISSCSDDTVSVMESSIEEDMPLLTRSAPINCGVNRVINPHLDPTAPYGGGYGPAPDCGNNHSAFTPPANFVPWSTVMGTPEFTYIESAPDCGTTQCTKHDYALMISKVNNQGQLCYEGIFGKCDVTVSSHISYTVAVEADSDKSGGSLQVYLGNNLVAAGGQDPGVMISLAGTERVGDYAIPAGDFCHENFAVYSTSGIRPAVDYFNILLFDDKIDAGSRGQSEVRYVEITCQNDYVSAIKVDGGEDCTFIFSMLTAGPVTAISYLWDFGDGNTSTASAPSHNYSTPGIYQVSLTVTDDLGCCTTITRAVTCETPACVSYICWVEIGLDECASSVELELPDGSTISVPFSVIPAGTHACGGGDIPAVVEYSEGHCELALQIKKAIESTGYPVVFDAYRNDIKTCYKGQYEVPGFFYTSQVKVIRTNHIDCTTGVPMPGNFGKSNKFDDYGEPCE